MTGTAGPYFGLGPNLLQVDDFGPEHLFLQCFNEFGGCCGNLCLLFYAMILHTFQDFELAVFKSLSRC